ncbi:hypothetical protein HID58_006204, partial [Brassica napus]
NALFLFKPTPSNKLYPHRQTNYGFKHANPNDKSFYEKVTAIKDLRSWKNTWFIHVKKVKQNQKQNAVRSVVTIASAHHQRQNVQLVVQNVTSPHQLQRESGTVAWFRNPIAPLLGGQERLTRWRTHGETLDTLKRAIHVRDATAKSQSISITAAGTGITVLFSVICSLASSRVPFCTNKFFNTGLGLSVVMAFKLAMRTIVISVEAKAK